MQAKTRQDLKRVFCEAAFSQRFTVYMDRQAVGALHGLDSKSWPKSKSGEQRNCTTTTDSVNRRVSIAEQ